MFVILSSSDLAIVSPLLDQDYFFSAFFFSTSILTKLTEGTVCLVCPDGEWHYRLIGTSRQRRRYLFTYFFAFFRREEESARQAQSASHALPVVRDVRSSLASRLPLLA